MENESVPQRLIKGAFRQYSFKVTFDTTVAIVDGHSCHCHPVSLNERQPDSTDQSDTFR